MCAAYGSYDTQYPPTSPERRACETTPPSLEHPSLSNSEPSKQGPEEDISPASPGSQAAETEESYPPPDTKAAGVQDLGARMLKSRDLSISSSSIGDLLRRHSPPQGATGCPRFWPRIATRRHRLPKILAQNPKNLPKSVLPTTQASKKTSIHASKHPSLGSQRSAAEAVAFSIIMPF